MCKKISSIVFTTVFTTFLLSILILSRAYCEVPRTLNFQGRLTDNNNNPLEGNHSFVFSIYDAPSGGGALWTEGQTLSISNGVYNCVLGSVTPLPSTINFNAPYYLQVTVDGETLPRQAISSSAYALNSERLGGVVSSDFLYRNVNGDVGIGTTNPTSSLTLANGRLQVTGESAPTGGAGVEIGNPNGIGVLLSYDRTGNAFRGMRYNALDHRFENSTAEYMRITNGKVGIGTTAPTTALTVASGRLQVTGESVPSAGAGVEIGNPNGIGVLLSYDRTGNAFRGMRYNALDHRFENSTAEYMRITNGNVGIATPAPTAKLDINADTFRLRTAKTPSAATDTGNKGDICWDGNYIYVCVDTNTWKRSNLSSW